MATRTRTRVDPVTWKRSLGATVVEFALVLLLFLTVFFAAIDVATMLWVDLTMQYAVREGVRCAVTGQVNCAGVTGQTQRYDGVIQTMRMSSMGLYDYLSPVVTVWTVAADGSYQPPAPAKSFGAGGQIIVVDVDCVWPLMTPPLQVIFPNGQFRFRVAATMKNEAFQ
jgi:Flp pilus assembly protein TadG